MESVFHVILNKILHIFFRKECIDFQFALNTYEKSNLIKRLRREERENCVEILTRICSSGQRVSAMNTF